MVLVDGELMRP